MHSVFDLKPQHLAQLLALGGATGEGDADDAQDAVCGHLLLDLLARPVSLDVARADSFPRVLGRSCGEIAAYEGRTMGEALFDPQTDVALLVAVKDYGKSLVRGAWCEAESAAATALYFGAVAAALAGHGRKITQHPLPRLGRSLAELEAKPWLPERLRELFRGARSRCGEPDT